MQITDLKDKDEDKFTAQGLNSVLSVTNNLPCLRERDGFSSCACILKKRENEKGMMVREKKSYLEQDQYSC